MKNPQFTASAVLAGATLALAGCGGDEPKAKTAAPVERSIFVSAVDCESAGKITIENCSTAIEKAIAAHEKSSPSYKSLGTCEETEGAGKCERVDDKNFRPMLAAFVFDGATPPVAKPLYLTVDGAEGFRSGGKDVLLGKDDNLVFSKSAKDLYELHGGPGEKKKRKK